MKKTKINSEKDTVKILQDKTDWSKVYNKSQSTADREAITDTENPVLRNVRFDRLSKDSKK